MGDYPPSSRNLASGMNFTLRLSAVICVFPVSGILRILPCLWRTSNLQKEGSFRVKPLTSMFLCDLADDGVENGIHDVVRFAIRAKVEGRTNPRCNGVASNLRT